MIMFVRPSVHLSVQQVRAETVRELRNDYSTIIRLARLSGKEEVCVLFSPVIFHMRTLSRESSRTAKKRAVVCVCVCPLCLPVFICVCLCLPRPLLDPFSLRLSPVARTQARKIQSNEQVCVRARFLSLTLTLTLAPIRRV